MLKFRILTALILIPIVIAGIALLPIPYFGVAIAIILSACALEWCFLIKLKIIRTFFYVLITLSILVMLSFTPIILAHVFLWVGLLWWILALVLVSTYPKLMSFWQNSLSNRILVGWCLILPTWSGLFVIIKQPDGRWLLLLLLILVWVADSGAYFVGKAKGQRKLAPNISPGKTVEGMLGGFITGAIVAIISALIMRYNFEHSLLYILILLIMIFAALLGDITESMFKRQQDVKDSGKLLPGHGGLLDRLDSVFAVAPLFALFDMLIKRFL